MIRNSSRACRNSLELWQRLLAQQGRTRLYLHALLRKYRRRALHCLLNIFSQEVRSRKDMCTPWALAHFVADARSSGVLLSLRCGDWQTSRQWLFHQRDPSVSTLNREPCRLRMELQQRNEKAFAFLSCQDCGTVCYCGTA